MDQDLGRPKLAEFTLDIPNPESSKDYYGVPHPDIVRRVREHTRKHYTRPIAKVDAEITARTSGVVDDLSELSVQGHPTDEKI